MQLLSKCQFIIEAQLMGAKSFPGVKVPPICLSEKLTLIPVLANNSNLLANNSNLKFLIILVPTDVQAIVM